LEADDAVEDETIAHLQTLIGFDTTNPPGDELELAEYLVRVLERDGIETEILEPRRDRAQVIARLKGNGTKRPVMLLAHMDVVGVEREKWSCDPFAGIVRDGYVYGRGAIDDKGMLSANLMAMLLLKRNVVDRGIELDRDVVFVATSDEESGGADGMQWIVANHPEILDAEFAINEGGRTRIIEGGKRYLAIQTSEKISHQVSVTARGPAGHAAIPLEGNAVFELGTALARLREYREPVTLTATTTRFFGDLASVWPVPEVADAMRRITSPDATESDNAADILARVPVFNAVMRNGISPVGLTGGVAGNVIPAEAKAMLNVRTIPGHKIEDVAARMAAVVNDATVTVVIESRGKEAPASDPDSEMFLAISAAAKALDPGIAVVPYLSTGGTDSAHLRRFGINAYGILPFPMIQADEERMHGHDERVPVQSLHFGVRLIYESVRSISVSLSASTNGR
jgi:Acetylornithine deacetylase/Succinyl-diaminopimelate desuccinylase and related deacylases